jgi:hypothetical protein
MSDHVTGAHLPEMPLLTLRFYRDIVLSIIKITMAQNNSLYYQGLGTRRALLSTLLQAHGMQGAEEIIIAGQSSGGMMIHTPFYVF